MGKSKKERKKVVKKVIPVVIRSEKKLTQNTKHLFWIITILLPIVAIALLEAGLRIFDYGLDKTLFVSIPDEKSPYYGINVNIGKRYFKKGGFSPTPRKDLFLKEKPENGYRIFVLGGSTTAGFPFGNNLTPTRILHRRLVDTFPDKKIEVVNCAMTAVNSYTMLDFMDEILEQKPDLILIYGGHNEFYGAMGVASMESFGRYRFVVKTLLKLQYFKVYELLENIILSLSGFISDVPSYSKDDPLRTQMAKMVKEKEIAFTSPLYQSGKEYFQDNLNEIFEKAAKAGVDVIISELVSNIKDHKPFVSIKENGKPSAMEKYEEGQILEKKGLYQEAKAAYYKAKDLDALRFRATEEFNDIIHKTAAKFNIPVMPMKDYFENLSLNGLIGNDLMFEHLHPNKKGYFVMGSAFFNELQKYNLINETWPLENIKPITYYMQKWGFSKLDSTVAALNIIQLKGGWPFKKEDTPNEALINFVPDSKEDSVALEILGKGKITLEMGHMNLAKYYQEKSNYQAAFFEHLALVYTVPWIDVFYEPFIDMLLKIQQYEIARSVLTDGLKYNQSAFIYKWLGQTNLVLGNTGQGIKILEEVHQKKMSDNQAIYNLIRAYYTTGQFERGDNLIGMLKENSALADYVKDLENYKKSLKSTSE
jgi:tetratricopeptide (TPR) repeat protein